MSAWQLFLSGGPLMWPIVVCGIISCAVIAERILYLMKREAGGREIPVMVFEHVKRNQIKEAVAMCDRCASPSARVLKAGILKYDRPRTQIREALDAAALCEVPLLEKNLFFLSMAAHLAPLLGFLGTVAGMIDCFYAVFRAQSAAAVIPYAGFAAGIWQSLVTTCAGLIVAIVSFAAYNCLAAKVNAVIMEMEKVSAELLDVLSE